MEFSVMMGILMEGFALTAEIFLITLVGSLPLGVVVALARMSKFKPLAWLAQLYISILRGTPLMLQLMAIMFGPYYLFGLNMGSDWKFWACAIGFILNYAAYFAEIYRSGIQSIPRGQYEAAEVLGYTKAQTFMKIVLPQVIKRILPAMGNEVITLVNRRSRSCSASWRCSPLRRPWPPARCPWFPTPSRLSSTGCSACSSNSS